MNKKGTFSLKERKAIEKMYKSGSTRYAISKQLGRAPISITREMQRCPEGEYNAEMAHRQASEIRINRAKKDKITQEKQKERTYKKIILACIRLNHSADAFDISMAAQMPIERVQKYYGECRKAAGL